VRPYALWCVGVGARSAPLQKICPKLLTASFHDLPGHTGCRYSQHVKRKTSERSLLVRYERLQGTLRGVMRRHPHADPDNVWHALLLLELPPLERLRRGLIRGQKPDLH
jgi:hypothetical protein